MIKAIVAVDSKQGIATAAGIPWDLPTDKAYFRDKTTGSPVLMGYRMYQEFDQPLPQRQNLVMVRPNTELKSGFEAIEDIPSLLDKYRQSQETLWIVGGAALYEKLIGETQEIYITRVIGDFKCTKFFPEFETDFTRVADEPPIEENGLRFHYEIWRRNS